jgi:adenine-specific DNA-methyltransferase
VNLSLFPGIIVDCPLTEGIKYAGSKLKILPYVLQLAQEVKPRTVFDGFAGTTRVSQAFARLGYKVICNDIAVWSKTFAQCYLQAKKTQTFYQELIDHLNGLPGKDGWFTEHYGGYPNRGSAIQGDGLKKPWQVHNTRKLDAVREEIDNLGLDEIDKSVLLTALILALDQVDNTVGHYASYLSDWSPRSYDTMRLEVPRIVQSSENHIVYQSDIFDILDNVEADLAYYDPPYGSNNEKMPPSRIRYAAYYHLWSTVCLNDKPTLFGKAKRRADTSDITSSSLFEEFRRNHKGTFIVVEAIERLLLHTQTRFVILSYSSGGRATAEELQRVINTSGELRRFVKVDYQRNVMASMRWTNEWVRDAETPNHEYLFLIEK